MSDIRSLLPALSSPKNIVITTHQKPDGDAMGSTLALYHYLKPLGHHLSAIIVTDYPAFLKWLPGRKEVVNAAFQADKATRLFQKADYIFCLDFNGLGRLNEFADIVKQSKATKIMIDHHTFPENFDDIRFWDDTASSTCEMIYRLIAEEWNDKAGITAQIATCLYTGIMTDTGSFRFNSTTPKVHRIIADLMDTGIEAHKIHENVYDTFSENKLRLWGNAFLNCLRVLPEKQTAYFVISRATALHYHMESGDTEGLVNYALAIKGIDFAAFIIEDEDRIKLSFRSKGDFGVNEFAKKFDGGGHFHAAAGRTFGLTLAETEDKFLSLLAEIR